jgi:hypothetical protein
MNNVEQDALKTATEMTINQVVQAMDIYSKILGKTRAAMDDAALAGIAQTIAINQASLAVRSKT